jgi:lipid-A-disaccharide synthase
MPESIFIVSGEESGDKHGASLIKALKRRVPDLSVGGMGGAKMIEAGLDGINSRELSVVGIIEVIEKSPKIIKTFKELKERLKAGRFDAVILIDFPDFNLRVAREAKRLGIPVIYYISPQVWAWRRGRIKKIATLVDKMLVVFPFEVPIYERAGVDVEYVGHPLIDSARCALTKEEARAELGLEADRTYVAMLPGSRSAEVRRHLPVMLGSARLIEAGIKESPGFLLPAAGSVDPDDLKIPEDGPEVKVLWGRMYEALKASDAAIVASGTATLETTVIGTPMVIVYSMSPVTYGIARILVGVEQIGLPNILAGRNVVTEFIQNEATPPNIAGEILDILKDTEKRNGIIKGYREIRDGLGSGGAAERAAEAVMQVIMKGPGR